jgi:hypothetical protein
LELADLYKNYINNCKLMIFKVPKNYDFTNFIQETKIKDFEALAKARKKSGK